MVQNGADIIKTSTHGSISLFKIKSKKINRKTKKARPIGIMVPSFIG